MLGSLMFFAAKQQWLNHVKYLVPHRGSGASANSDRTEALAERPPLLLRVAKQHLRQWPRQSDRVTAAKTISRLAEAIGGNGGQTTRRRCQWYFELTQAIDNDLMPGVVTIWASIKEPAGCKGSTTAFVMTGPTAPKPVWGLTTTAFRPIRFC